jgi:hypothetical protein
MAHIHTTRPWQLSQRPLPQWQLRQLRRQWQRQLTEALNEIKACERALKRKLSLGECRDLLKDQFDDWSSHNCNRIVVVLNAEGKINQ